MTWLRSNPSASLLLKVVFGLNFDLFESNIINLAIRHCWLVWFCARVFGKRS